MILSGTQCAFYSVSVAKAMGRQSALTVTDPHLHCKLRQSLWH